MAKRGQEAYDEAEGMEQRRRATQYVFFRNLHREAQEATIIDDVAEKVM